MSTHRKDSSLEKISDDARVLVGVFWGLFPQSEGKKKVFSVCYPSEETYLPR